MSAIMVDFTFDGGDSVPKVKKPTRRTKKTEGPVKRSHRKKAPVRQLTSTYEIQEVLLGIRPYVMHYYICECGHKTSGSLNKIGALRTMQQHQKKDHSREV